MAYETAAVALLTGCIAFILVAGWFLGTRTGRRLTVIARRLFRRFRLAYVRFYWKSIELDVGKESAERIRRWVNRI